MALDCDEIMGRTTIPQKNHGNDCNPQEDSHKAAPQPALWPTPIILEQMKIEARKAVLDAAPWPTLEDDLPPWSQLEKMKQEANEVAMHSFPSDENQAKITVISGSKNEAQAVDENSLVDKQGFPKAPGNASSEYTSFPKSSSGYVYPTEGATIASSLEDQNSTEGHEQTVENFNQYLEISSMTTNSFDHAVTMGRLEEKQERKSLWPERLLQAPEMANAPAGILLVFDRMLDCIDPKERHIDAIPEQCDEEYVCGYETDQSSIWSVSLNQSWLDQFEEFSITGSTTTDEGSFLRFASGEDDKADWLDESFDCIFPCWKEPVVCDEPKHRQHKRVCSQKELVEALEASRKRKWASNEQSQEDNKSEPATEEHEKSKKYEVRESESLSTIKPVLSSESCHDDNDDDDPFDFPSPEFPPMIWKKLAPIEIEPDKNSIESEIDENASGSSLSELFQGLVHGTPSDEKDERVRELHAFLDHTSATEETSTLSYSDGTI